MEDAASVMTPAEVIPSAPEFDTPVELMVVVVVPPTTTDDKNELDPDHILVFVNNDMPPLNEVVMNE